MAVARAILLLFAVGALGVYALPNIAATFAGVHTMEVNRSLAIGQRVLQVNCASCHTWIVDELKAGSIANSVFLQHRNASQNTTYTYSVFKNNTSEGDGSSTWNDTRTCQMCHVLESSSVGLGHTQAFVRVCASPECHGNGTATDNTVFTWTGNITPKLNSSTDAHKMFFRKLDALDNPSGYADPATGQNWTAGYFACMACHTHVGMRYSITSRYNAYNVTRDRAADTFTMTINQSSWNTTTVEAYKPAGQGMWT